MPRLQRIFLPVLVLLAAAISCAVPNISITDPVVQATQQALTIDAAVQASQQAAGPASATATATTSPSPGPSPTASQTATPSLTPTPSETPSPTITSTPVIVASPTSLVPFISVSVPTNCRLGPGKAYSIDGALLVGETAQVYGRDPTGDFWYIPNPDSPGDFCWVWDEYATFTGFTGSVPIFTPPPTPTATMTPTPEPGFTASYEGLVWCTGTWWTEIALENTSLITFRSIEFVLRDLDLDTSVTDQADSFVDRPDCSSSSSKLTLQAGKTTVVSSPGLDNNPDGHKLRANITLCSKTGQEGECVTEIIRFTP